MSIWVVLPTYNERENLPSILGKLFELHLSDLYVLVVDDASPDGTGQLAESFRERFASLHILHRKKKEGLGSAYLVGFRYALGQGAEYIVEMDADLSHPVAELPAMIAAASDADLVLGSRYVTGGQVENWNFIRRAVSRFGNFYARIILGVHLHDLTGGYKCFRRRTLELLDLDGVSSIGYSFQVELTYKTLREHLRVVEYPITFTERRIGRSKFHLGIMWECMIQVWRLRRLGPPPKTSVLPSPQEREVK